jgi:hypothetical protein
VGTADFSVIEDPSDADVAALRGVLSHQNAATVGSNDHGPFAIFIRDGDGTIVGGLSGNFRCGSFAISFLIVPEGMRERVSAGI